MTPPTPVAAEVTATVEKAEVPPGKGKMFDRLLGKSKSHYQEGLRLYYREWRYADAIAAFDRALAIDPSHAFAWHDRAVCLRALERNEEALESVTKALELAPADEEILFTCAETLQKMGSSGMMTRSSRRQWRPTTGCWRRTRRMPMHGTTWVSASEDEPGRTVAPVLREGGGSQTVQQEPGPEAQPRYPCLTGYEC